MISDEMVEAAANAIEPIIEFSSAVGRSLALDVARAALEAAERAREDTQEAAIVCGELYQVIGTLADYAGVYDHPEVIRAMDNAAANERIHKDLLPWPKRPLPSPPGEGA